MRDAGWARVLLLVASSLSVAFVAFFIGAIGWGCHRDGGGLDCYMFLSIGAANGLVAVGLFGAAVFGAVHRIRRRTSP